MAAARSSSASASGPSAPGTLPTYLTKPETKGYSKIYIKDPVDAGDFLDMLNNQKEWVTTAGMRPKNDNITHFSAQAGP